MGLSRGNQHSRADEGVQPATQPLVQLTVQPIVQKCSQPHCTLQLRLRVGQREPVVLLKLLLRIALEGVLQRHNILLDRLANE